MKRKKRSVSKNAPHPAAVSLLHWYKENKRDLPWRQTGNPYKIWLSEVILQQTRVEQGLPYYERFVERFPDVKSLAQAQMEEVAKLWQGLGYYTRAQNLHEAAIQVCKDFNGEFPTVYHELMKLKGVGDYTASAVASISAGETVPAIDGNAYRVFSRLFVIEEPIDKPATRKIFRRVALDLMIGLPAGDFNQAVMELGARICKPRRPDCSSCPLLAFCPSKTGKWENLPVKSKKKKLMEMNLHYLLFFNGDKVLMQRRGKTGLWKNLTDFPSVENPPEHRINPDNPNFIDKIREIWGAQQGLEVFSKPEPYQWILSHALTHRRIKAEFWKIKMRGATILPSGNDYFWIHIKDAPKQALPKIMEKFFVNFATS